MAGHKHPRPERHFGREGAKGPRCPSLAPATIFLRAILAEWNSAVLDHLAGRIATRERTGYKWTQESERFLAYWQRHGRIVFADCGLDS